MSKALPILCYHKVGTLKEEGRWLNVEPETLRSHIRFFARRKYSFVQACDLANHWPSRAVCLTFDDAYTSTLTTGIEVMRQESATASIFVVSSLTGKSSEWDGVRAAKLADTQLIIDASHLGFEIGNHTANHPRLSKLSEVQQLHELTKCHQVLVDLNIHPTTIAYPYGSHNQATFQAAQSLGYTVGLALSRRPANPTDQKLALPRIVISYGDRLPSLLYKLFLRPLLPSTKRREDYVA
ncbi:MAG: polysaccharide deacetylase family protein [Fimbriimonadaceae bacterium]|nr:polysaccharide deacetylase family protein [Fimbriimonadaceae bacterium]